MKSSLFFCIVSLTLLNFISYSGVYASERKVIKCGICSSGGQGLNAAESQFPSLKGKIPACRKDQPPLELTCPKSYLGCLTQSEGSIVSKMCSTIPINDCKTANAVEYCYCRGELCNVERIPAASTTNQQSQPIPGDDEDTVEGSGYSPSTTHKNKPIGTKPSSTTTTNTSNKQHNNNNNRNQHSSTAKPTSNKSTYNSISFILLHISFLLILAQ